MSSKKGSGPHRAGPQGNKAANRSRQVDPKNHGHPAAHKKKTNRASSGAEEKRAGSSRRSREESRKQAPIVVCTESSHPHSEPGTFDAAALLESVLKAVEPELRESMRALEKKLVSEQGQDEIEGQSPDQGLRSLGRQISEALRAAVIEGMRVRERHLAQLVVIDRAAAQSANITRLQERIGTEIQRAGVRRVAETSDLSLFNLASGTETGVLESEGEIEYELITPAYIDTDTGRVIERGWLRPAPQAGSSPPQGKSHGRLSRTNKGRNAGRLPEGEKAQGTADEGNQRRVEDAEGGQVRRRKDHRQKEAAGAPPVHEELTKPHDGELLAAGQNSSGVTRSTGPAETSGSAAGSKSEQDRRRDGVEAKRRDSSAREATRVASSYFVKRMLGDTADQEQPPRRSS